MGAFTDFVDPNAFTVHHAPDYIFLCGGRLDDLTSSLRAQFYEKKVKADPDLLSRIQLAETADSWYLSRREFAHLLELEEHLAGLSACVLLFVESPGAIAEFGAFSQMRVLKEKLIVVVEESHFDQQSFIRNGLIEQTMLDRPDSLLSYPWLTPAIGSAPRVIEPVSAGETLNEVERAVQRFVASKPKSSRFDHADHGHRMLLIADLIRLNVIFVQNEIQELLAYLGVALKAPELKKYLYLLEKLEIVGKKRYGNLDFYVAGSQAKDFIHYAPKSPADRMRLRALLREEFPLKGEKKKALDSFERRAAGVRP